MTSEQGIHPRKIQGRNVFGLRYKDCTEDLREVKSPKKEPLLNSDWVEYPNDQQPIIRNYFCVAKPID